MRIFHLEDNPADVRLVGINLKMAGLEVDLKHFATWREAKAALTYEVPQDEDGFLMDWNLNDCNGEVILEFLRSEMSPWRYTPIAVFSGANSTVEDIENMSYRRLKGFVKPSSLTDFKNTLDDIISFFRKEIEL